MILAMQLGLLRSAEATKATRRLQALQKNEIGPQLARGHAVTVTVVMEVPNQVDIAAIWAGTGDTGQVVYFKKMYVSRAHRIDRRSDRDTAHSHYHENARPQTGVHPWYVSENRKENRARPGFHLVERDLTIQPPSSAKAAGSDKLAGTYRPVGFQLLSGNAERVTKNVMNRLLHWDRSGTTEMWDTDYRVSFRSEAATILDVPRPVRTHYVRGEAGRDYVIDSTIEIIRGSSSTALVETATGEDLDPQWRMGSRWRAKVALRR